MNQKERSNSFFDYGKKEGVFDKEKENNFSNLMFPSEKEQVNMGENLNFMNFQKDIDSKNFKNERKQCKSSGMQ